MTSAPRPRRGRGRRPVSAVRSDVLTAAGHLLKTEGVKGFTIDKVVAASGVSPATVYKHWPSRGALALDGYVQLVGDSIDVHDTGDIKADIEDVVLGFVRMVTRVPEGAIFAQLIGAAQTDPDLAAQFDDHYFGPRRRQVLALLDKAKQRQQIQGDADTEVLVDLIWGACYVRLLLPHLTAQLSAAFGEKVVDHVLSGVLT